VVGGLWNAEHTLMQRYGLSRIYGRRAGDEQGRVEKAMIVAWFLIPLLSVAARDQLNRVVDRFGQGSVDAGAARILARLSPEAAVALPLVVGAAIWLMGRWLRQERRHGVFNPGKWMYLASTAGLFAVALVDPVAALVGFVGSHSIEYFVVVNRSIASEASCDGALGRVSRRPHGRAGFFVAYLAAATTLFFVLYDLAPARVLLVTVLTIGALHFFYDSFIWKLRKPAVAASLAGSPTARA